MDAASGDLKRGPYAFTANVRGIDVDPEAGLVFGATRGSGVEIMDAATGAPITVTPAGASPWRSHGVAWDGVNDRLYVGTADAEGSTDGVRVFAGATWELVGTIPMANADLRSLAVDTASGWLIAGHQSATFDASGVSVYSTDDLSLVARLSAHAYGNKVYGVSVNPTDGEIYVSARDRFPRA